MKYLPPHEMAAVRDWQRYGLAAPPVPGASILHCALCNREVHRSLPDDPVHEEAFWEQAEEQCRAHMLTEHRTRFILWERFRWRWLIGGMLPW